jgi:hypothetical protein
LEKVIDEGYSKMHNYSTSYYQSQPSESPKKHRRKTAARTPRAEP